MVSPNPLVGFTPRAHDQVRSLCNTDLWKRECHSERRVRVSDRNTELSQTRWFLRRRPVWVPIADPDRERVTRGAWQDGCSAEPITDPASEGKLLTGV